uniref:XIAP associated factor 1 n=1 Tax=Amphilophus citrinellus TaxID=61819 RepID=A0A3Q0T235_AMPCI
MTLCSSRSLSHKEVAEANFALHETHCSRFLCLCPDCNEAVPRDQLKEHREEQHAEVRCSKCNKKMERCQLQDHEADECVERLQKCQFCDLEVPCKDLDKHCLVCGSRTELCRDCGRYVTLKDQPEHGLTCSYLYCKPAVTNNTFVKPLSVFPTNQLECTARHIPYYDVPEEESEDEDDYLTQVTSTDKELTFSGRPSHDPWINGGDPNLISTCPYCHLALPFSTLQWHKVTFLKHRGFK